MHGSRTATVSQQAALFLASSPFFPLLLGCFHCTLNSFSASLRSGRFVNPSDGVTLLSSRQSLKIFQYSLCSQGAHQVLRNRNFSRAIQDCNLHPDPIAFFDLGLATDLRLDSKIMAPTS